MTAIKNCCANCAKNENCPNEDYWCGFPQQEDCEEGRYNIACQPCEEFEEVKHE